MGFKSKVPNFLTILRVLISPIVIAILLIPGNNKKTWYLIAGILFLFCCITDFLDGYLSRKWKVTSNFGKTFDPMADKVLIIGSLVCLMKDGNVILFLALVLIIRDILMDTIRLILFKQKKVIPASNIAKLKTVLQMIGILILLFGAPSTSGWFTSHHWPYQIPLIAAAIVSWLSFGLYVTRINRQLDR